MILLVYTLRLALKLLVTEQMLVYNRPIKHYFITLITLLGIQLFYGAFMAGLHAALYAPTWPKMNGVWLPPLLSEQSWINNPINVQFIHRGLAYIILIMFVIGSIKILKLAKLHNSVMLRSTANWSLILIVTQIALGIFALTSSPFIKKGNFGLYEILAQSHQLIAMCLLITFVIILYIVNGKSTSR